MGRGDLFVVEADEYADNYAPYHPDLVVLTSVEWDHPDVFADLEGVLAAFERWLRAAGRTLLVANVGDPGVARLVERLRGWEGRIERVAVTGAPGAGLVARVGVATPELQAIVNNINIQRKRQYTQQAAASSTVEQMAFVTGCNLIARTAPGEKYRAPDGRWLTRGSEPPVRDPRCL